MPVTLPTMFESTDASENQLLIEALRESEERFRSAFEHAADGAVVPGLLTTR